MKKKKKGINLIMPFILIVALSFPFMLSKMQQDYQTYREETNQCSEYWTCQCKDKCADIDGYSNWESWYAYDKECWCIDQNKTSRRIF